MTVYFNSSAYTVVDGNIVYAADLNDPFSAIGTGFTTLISNLRSGSGIKTGTDTGSANTYALNLDPAITAYVDGLEVWFKPANSNTGASTLNVNGLGAKAIKKYGLEALSANDLRANYWIGVKYDGTQFQIISSAGSSESAAATYAAQCAAYASDCSDYADTCSDHEDACAAYVASLDLPTISGGDADKILQVKDDESGYELVAMPATNDVPVGTEAFWSGASPPTDWFEQDGSELAKATYPELLAVIGTMYGETDGAGGVGATHFRLPDPRGKFIRVWDNGAGVDPDAATRTDRGDTTDGDSNGTNQASQNKQHNHTGSTNTTGAHTHTYYPPVAYPVWTAGGAGYKKSTTDDTSSDGDHSHTITINNDGGDEARPINTYRMMIIKYQ